MIDNKMIITRMAILMIYDMILMIYDMIYSRDVHTAYVELCWLLAV